MKRATATAAALSHPVKLVVWDLDDSFWRGTLSEGTPVLIDAHVELVRALNRRGVVNAICSNNELEVARDLLNTEGVWDEFVFPSISWDPKGPRIRQIIDDAQLRPSNVLFVDDNPHNLQEASYYCPGIQTATPDRLSALQHDPHLAGAPDTGLRRLAHYRVLENKVRAREASGSSNDEFMRSSGVELSIERKCGTHLERILDLENRSNQLNFTKRRLSRGQLVGLLHDESIDAGIVWVRDRFGDYGLAGFFSLAPSGLLDFAFSCRILNMGIEQYVYRQLGRPMLRIVGEVASDVMAAEPIGWVTEISPEEWARGAPARPENLSLRPQSDERPVLLLGGCDLEPLASWIGGPVDTEFNFVSPTGSTVHRDHTNLVRQAVEGVPAAFLEVVDRIPFLTRDVFTTRLGEPQRYRAVVYSLLMDYTQGVYRHRATGHVVTYGQAHIDITDEREWPELMARSSGEGLTHSFLRWFRSAFDYEGRISGQQFVANLRWLRASLHPNTRLILLNAAELAIESNARETNRHLIHAEYNSLLDDAVASMHNATIVDVRPLVRDRDDVKDNLRHYSRPVLRSLAERILVETALEPRSGRRWQVGRFAERTGERGRRAASRFTRNQWRGRYSSR